MTSLTTKFQPIHFMFIIMSLLSILQRTLVTSKFTNQEEGLKVIHEIDSTDIADDDKTISTESSDDNNIFNVNGTISTESSDNIFNVNGIVGGRYSSFGGYPFYASILIHNVKSGKWEAICGGALIDKNWVLSAAHCIVSGYTYAVEIGRYTYKSGNGGQYMEKRKAEIVCTNPKFDKLKVKKDFGLLYFETPSKITPAKLDYGEIKFRESHPFVILGFGSTGSTGQGPFPDVLQAGDVYYVSNDKCGADWDEYIDTSVLCSSSHSSGDSCKGDSGGPLIVNDGKYQNYLAGIVSYGPVPCDGSVPVLYGRVAEAQDWIERVISSTGDTSKCGEPLTFARRRNLLRNYEGITNFQNKNGSFGDFFESNNI